MQPSNISCRIKSNNLALKVAHFWHTTHDALGVLIHTFFSKVSYLFGEFGILSPRDSFTINLTEFFLKPFMCSFCTNLINTLG